jgi:phosphoesterase RecJ-like protein
MNNIEELQALLASPKKIVITTHQKPDGDAMGSSLALYNYLQPKGHHVRVVTPTDFPTYFNWMPNCDEVWNFEENPTLSNALVYEADLIFCLDFNDLNRIEPFNQAFAQSQAKIVLLDHHLYPKDFADFILHDTKACSTCELVFRFLALLDPNYTPSKDVATCIYTGILTDTGSFSNGATNRKAFEITAQLLDSDLNIIDVQENLNQNGREEKLRFIGNALNRKLSVREDLGIAYIVVDRKDAYRFNLQNGDTEGLVNYPLSIAKIKVAILIKQEAKMIKLSFRSKKDISVEEICRKYFEGGGHKNASGGKSYLSLEETIDKIIAIFEKEKIV